MGSQGDWRDKCTMKDRMFTPFLNCFRVKCKNAIFHLWKYFQNALEIIPKEKFFYQAKWELTKKIVIGSTLDKSINWYLILPGTDN